MPIATEGKAMPTGKVKKWISDKAFGFIQSDQGGPDVFFHETALREGDDIVEGAAVTCETDVDKKTGKTKAVSVDLI